MLPQHVTHRTGSPSNCHSPWAVSQGVFGDRPRPNSARQLAQTGGEAPTRCGRWGANSKVRLPRAAGAPRARAFGVAAHLVGLLQRASEAVWSQQPPLRAVRGDTVVLTRIRIRFSLFTSVRPLFRAKRKLTVLHNGFRARRSIFWVLPRGQRKLAIRTRQEALRQDPERGRRPGSCRASRSRRLKRLFKREIEPMSKPPLKKLGERSKPHSEQMKGLGGTFKSKASSRGLTGMSMDTGTERSFGQV